MRQLKEYIATVVLLCLLQAPCFANCCDEPTRLSQGVAEKDKWFDDDDRLDVDIYQKPEHQNIQGQTHPISGKPEAVQAPTLAVLNTLEIAILGRMSSKGAILPRTEELEKHIFGDKAENQKSLDLQRRLNDLCDVVIPTPEQFAKGHEGIKPANNWFLNPPDIPWLKKMGKSMKDSTIAAKEGAHGIARFVTSPQFITLLGIGAAAVGTYYLSKHLGNSNYYTEDGACTGSMACGVCKNCSRCIHCNSGGSPCRVWYLVRGMVAPW